MKQRAREHGGKDEAFRWRVQRWAEVIRVCPRQIRLQTMRRKWASCSTRGTVSFSRDLLARTCASQDRVIVHELVHLRVPNHGRLFKRMVTSYLACGCPSAKSRGVRQPPQQRTLLAALYEQADALGTSGRESTETMTSRSRRAVCCWLAQSHCLACLPS
jgi:hypothetical protein